MPWQNLYFEVFVKHLTVLKIRDPNKHLYAWLSFLFAKVKWADGVAVLMTKNAQYIKMRQVCFKSHIPILDTNNAHSSDIIIFKFTLSLATNSIFNNKVNIICCRFPWLIVITFYKASVAIYKIGFRISGARFWEICKQAQRRSSVT